MLPPPGLTHVESYRREGGQVQFAADVQLEGEKTRSEA